MSLVLATILVKVVGTVFCNYHLADISSMKQQTNKQTNKQKTYTHRQKRYGLENMHLRENLLQG